ncbi:hypothetical protein [Paenibacillus macquariensis]|uniref:Uncharacterized protein n=1 Tax=Paenibacillus macquariensis TaxID=948756 RepID=A0ABY1JW09_9BACL|nr:hypothetical protein [Paenibacillus macquariensis]MEC0090674.1 hypothetical protein [Paenibacillus macquariensis]OAB34427.1 hypothetical protein PMSM_11175 [Paenibacillus macquariensis subsp. macquariensis]SIQ86521.1 hypothetical protein SAMN05421578_104398 [Paenibacillus macquariensis]
MTFTKKMIVSALVLSMFTVSLGGLPMSQKGFVKNLGLIQTVNAAELEQLSNPLIERMIQLYDALVTGGPADVKSVMNLRDELVGFDYMANRQLFDPIWNKIRVRIPESVDQTELKAGIFRLIQAVGSIQSKTDLDAFRSNPDFQAMLKMIAAASGNMNIGTNDLLVFLFGDGGNRIGLEGKVRNIIENMSLIELIGLVGNSQAVTEVLLQAVDKQLSETDTYKISSILNKLDISSQDIRTLVINIQAKLKKDDAAINAISFAYIRTATQATAEISENGRKQSYSLKLFEEEIPSLVLKWSKVSGSDDVIVAPNGVVTIPEGVQSGSAVIRAMIVNPYGKFAKVIFEKEVTLVDDTVVQENIFPVEEYLQRWNKITDALVAGGSSDVNNVRKLRDELIGLSFAKDQEWIDPIWNPIAQNLPESVDQVALKNSLFDIIKSVGSIQYDVEAAQMEAVRANPEFRATLKTIATVAGVPTLTIDDILIMMFGDGRENGGVEKIVRNTLANMSSNELDKLLSNKDGLDTVKSTALSEVLSDKNGYAVSDAMFNLGIRPDDIASMVTKFKSKLKNDEKAIKAMNAAYIYSEAESTVKITDNGRQHAYGMTVLGVEIPSSSLKWKKVSGSKDVKVDSKGEVKISNKVENGTAVIQASLAHFLGGSSKVIFEQEVTLVNDDFGKDPAAEIQKIVKTFESTVTELKQRLRVATTDSEKIQLLVEVVQAGNDSFDQISPIEFTKSVKTKAINNIKKQVTQMSNLIIESLMKF